MILPVTSQKKLTIVLLVLFVLIVAAATVQILNNTQDDTSADDALDPAFLFYRDLGAPFRDCGSEDLLHGFGYNKNMRECFKDAHTTCTQAKLHQKITTIEGDPIFTTLVIEGEAPRGCAVHIYTDSRDRFGSVGVSDTICYATTFDSSSGQDSLLFDECENGTQQYFY